MKRHVRALIYLLPDVWRTLIGERTTVAFPFGEAEIAAGFRGRVEIHADRCRGCGLCVRDCPAFALELERESRQAFRLIYYPDRCAYCGQCELSCPAGAIYQTNEFVRATTDPATLAVTLVDRQEPEPEQA